MSNIWKTLELPKATSDLAVIKKAYARKLKSIRADEDPNGFMKLRRAYESAREYARFHSADTAEPVRAAKSDQPAASKASIDHAAENPADGFDSPINTQEIHSKVTWGPPKSAPKHSEAYNLIMGQIDVLKTDPIARNLHQQWDIIFANLQDVSIDEYAQLDNSLRDLLLSIFGYYQADPPQRDGLKKWLPRSRRPITPDLLRYIFSNMNWDRGFTSDAHIQYELTWLQEQGRTAPKTKILKTGQRQTFLSELKRFGVIIGVGIGLFFPINFLEAQGQKKLDALPEIKASIETRRADLEAEKKRLTETLVAAYQSEQTAAERLEITQAIGDEIEVISSELELIDDEESEITDGPVLNILLFLFGLWIIYTGYFLITRTLLVIKFAIGTLFRLILSTIRNGFSMIFGR